MGFHPIDLSLASFKGPLVFGGDACGPVGALAPGRGVLDLARLHPKDAQLAIDPWSRLSLEEVSFLASSLLP
jgi:hypothetical protein